MKAALHHAVSIEQRATASNYPNRISTGMGINTKKVLRIGYGGYRRSAFGNQHSEAALDLASLKYGVAQTGSPRRGRLDGVAKAYQA